MLFWWWRTKIILTEESIVEIRHTCEGNDIIFVKPKQIVFGGYGSIPNVIGKGTDEWSLDFEETDPYIIPVTQPQDHV